LIMEVEKKIKNFKALSKVVKKADLESIFLARCTVWRSLDALEYENVALEVVSEGSLLEQNKEHFIAKTSFSAKGQPEEGEKEVASLESEYILTYSLKGREQVTTEDLEQFCHINAIYNAWPYWREFLQNMSNRMELPTLTLPLLKFRQEKKKKED
jgi:hypothetical protein